MHGCMITKKCQCKTQYPPQFACCFVPLQLLSADGEVCRERKLIRAGFSVRLTPSFMLLVLIGREKQAKFMVNR